MSTKESQILTHNLLFVIPLLFKKMLKDVLCNKVDFRKLHILFVLKKHSGLSMTDYSKILSLPKSNLTIIVNELVTDGCVSRKMDETDRRLIYLEITEKGKALAEESMKKLEKHMEKYLTTSLSGEEIENLNSYVEGVVSILGRQK